MDDKVFFHPGDLVTLKQNIPYKPSMYVVKKITSDIKTDSEITNNFIGIKCRWFNKNHELQEAIYSTKDLILL